LRFEAISGLESSHVLADAFPVQWACDIWAWVLVAFGAGVLSDFFLAGRWAKGIQDFFIVHFGHVVQPSQFLPINFSTGIAASVLGWFTGTGFLYEFGCPHEFFVRLDGAIGGTVVVVVLIEQVVVVELVPADGEGSVLTGIDTQSGVAGVDEVQVAWLTVLQGYHNNLSITFVWGYDRDSGLSSYVGGILQVA